MDVSCPWCGHRPSEHVQTVEGQPQAPVVGAASICGYCARVSIFDNGPLGMYLRFPNEEEWAQIRANEDLQEALALAKAQRWRWQG